MFGPRQGNKRAGLVRAAIFLAGALGAGAGTGSARADGYFCDPAGVANDDFGAALQGLADINADGYSELLAGQPGWTTDDGRVLLWLGAAPRTVTPDRAWTGAGGERLGACVADIGDVNGGGRPDFAVGAPLFDLSGTDRGRVYVFYGESLPASGTASARASLILEGLNGGDNFGWSISAAGDFDGDGKDDFIVGAPRNDGTASDAGAAYVIYGAAGGPSADLADATVLSGQIAGDLFGWSVCDAGNFLAGAEDCVAVGAPSNNTHGGIDGGAVYVYRGRTDGGAPDSVADFATGSGGTAADSQFGFAVRNAGRWNTDAYDDLAVGAPYSNTAGLEAGRIEITFGATTPTSGGDRYVNGAVAGDHFGWSLARVHNVLGAAAEDLLIGAPGADTPAADAGRAYVFRGGASSQASAATLDTYADVPLRAGTEPGDLYGTAVASAGDFDNDGLWDFAIGAPAGSSEPTGALSGFVRLVHSSAGPVANLLQSWRAAWVTGVREGQVDLAFTLSEPVAGIARVAMSRIVRDAAGDVRDTAPVWSGTAFAGPARAGILVTDGAGYRFLDAGPVAVPEGGSLAYAVTATTVDGLALPVGELAGPAGPAPAFGLAVAVFPNPSSSAAAVFSFRALPGDAVAVNIFDVRGRLVRELYRGDGTGAWGQVAWDGRDMAGRQVSAGVYFLGAHSSEGTRTTRLTLVR